MNDLADHPQAVANRPLVSETLPVLLEDGASLAHGLDARRGNLAGAVAEQLLARIESGTYAVGARLPSQEALSLEFAVSRTVIREAVASLRQSGHLVVRQGAGVFVATALPTLAFGSFVAHDLDSAVHILELRMAVEVEQAALAAERRTPAALAALTAAYDHFNQLDGEDAAALVQADYRFHLAIAQATQNPQFVHFFQALGQDIFRDLHLKYANIGGARMPIWRMHNDCQHGAILAAISIGDAAAAREAVRSHLNEGLARYHMTAAALPEGAATRPAAPHA